LDKFNNQRELLEQLLSPQEPAGVRAAVLATCAQYDAAGVAELLLSHYGQFPPAEKLKADGVVGIILSGGPQSVYAKQAPHPDARIFELGIPVLGICYGVQLMGYFLGGEVEHSKEREYGHGHLTIKRPGKLFAGLPRKLRIWNSHGDKLTALPPGFVATAISENSPFSGIEDAKLAQLAEKLGIEPKKTRTLIGQLIRSRNTRPAAIQFLFLLANAIARLCFQEYQLRQRINELTVVYNLTMLLSEARDLPAVLKRTVELVSDVMGTKAASIRLIDQQKDELVIKAGSDTAYISAQRVALAPVDLRDPVHPTNPTVRYLWMQEGAFADANDAHADLLLARTPEGVQVMTLADPLAPVEVSSIPMPDAVSIAAAGQTLYIAASGHVVPVDLSDAETPSLGTSTMRATAPQQMATAAGKLVIADTYALRVYGPDTAPVPPPRPAHPRAVRP